MDEFAYRVDPDEHNLELPTIRSFQDNSEIIFFQGPVVQSILSLTSSLRGQLVKFFTTL